MPVTRKIYRRGEQPVPLTVEQLAEIAALKCLPDSDIDHSDDLPSANKPNWVQASLEKIQNTPFALEPKHLGI
jgi:hypothetical protein